MKLPFGVHEFLQVFRDYNLALQPLQLYVYLALLTVLFLFVSKTKAGLKVSFAFLAVIWFINGCAYHILFFSKINPIAKVFGALFIIQGLLFVLQVIFSKPYPHPDKLSIPQKAGWLIILYGTVLYSILGFFFGHSYPYAPVFGIAPCPTVIFTLGFLLALHGYAAKYLYIIPLLWAAIGSTAAFQLGMKEDLGLLASAMLALYFLFAPKSAKPTQF